MSIEHTTTRPVDLAQLAAELGGTGEPAPLSMSDDGTERVITCHDDEITQAQLDAAVEAHVPAPTPPTDAEVIANLKARLVNTEQALEQIVLDALMGNFPPL